MKEGQRSMKLGLRGRLVLVTIPILLIVIGAATAVSVVSFQNGYLASVQSRLEAIATPLTNAAQSYLGTTHGADVLSMMAPDLRTSIETNKGVANVLAIDLHGTIVADPRVGETVKKVSPTLTSALASRSAKPEPFLVHDGAVYQAMIPLLNQDKVLKGYLAISTPAELVEGEVRKAIISSAVVSVVAILLIAFGLWAYVTFTIARPVSDISQSLHVLAQGEGDLTRRLPIRSRNEIGELATNFNTHLDKLHEIIAEIIGAAGRVATAAEELAANSREMARGAEDQTSKTTQVASAMQEMAATVIQVSRNAEEVTRASRDAAGVASKGQSIVFDTVEKMRGIAERVKISAGVIRDLGQESNQIGAIIEVIDDIADQTNLLALNAAIEAARAGDQGRGFAVVADEVRKLAERTGKATKEIGQMITAIQGRTSVVVGQMDERTHEVEEGLTQAHRAGDSLGEIVQVVKQVLTQAEQIASASQEQSSATEEVSSHVEAVATIARQTSAGTTTTAQATEELARLAHQMQNTLGRFTLRDQN
jgi:methyl-accepting chemotaxis protein